jgi:hypothetical protein
MVSYAWCGNTYVWHRVAAFPASTLPGIASTAKYSVGYTADIFHLHNILIQT